MTQVTTGMVGAGFYDANSAPQWMAIAAVLPVLEAAIADLSLPASPATLAVADFGCSEGGNSTRAMGGIVAALRGKSGRPIQVIQSDLPTNDYRALMKRLAPEARAETYGADVYGAVVPGSMFERLVPPSSLTVATTFNAIGFLSRKPLSRLPGYVLPHGPADGRPGHVDAADFAACRNQAAADLSAFLTARAEELAPGGLCLVEVFGADERHSTSHAIYDALYLGWTDALEAGRIDRETYERFYQPVWMRTVEELTAPLTGPAATHADRFRLIAADRVEVPYPFWDTYKRDGDADAFAVAFVDFFRAFTAPVVAADLPPDSTATLDFIYERAKAHVAADPARFEPHYVSVYALMERLG